MESSIDVPVLWTKVTCGFDVGEETAHFGTRAAAVNEHDVCLYESVTRATIEPSEDNYAKPIPKCVIASSRSHVAIGLNDSLVIFPIDFSTVSAVFNSFGLPIAAMKFSEDSSFLLFVREDSALFAFHFESNTIIPIALKLIEIDNFSECAPHFLLITFTSLDSFFIADCTQRLIQISLETSLDAILQEEDQNKRKELFSSVQENSAVNIVENSTSKVFKNCVACSFVKESQPGVVWASGSSMKIFHDNYSQSFSLEFDHEIVKAVVVSPCCSLALCLVESGVIYIVSLDLGITIKRMDSEDVISSLALVSPSTSDLFHYKLLALVEVPVPQLVVFDFPGFKKLYSLKVPKNSELIPGLSMDSDSIYLEKPNKRMEFKVKCIEESLPSMRLDRLIFKGRFEEAEALAKVFSLDSNVIQQAKVDLLVRSLNPSRCSLLSQEEFSSNFDKLLTILGTVKDVEFVIEVCISSLMAELKWTEKLLDFALEKAKSSKLIDGNKIDFIIDLKIRLNLLTILHYNKTYLDWIHFSTVDLFLECEHCLCDEQIDSACTILSVLKTCYPKLCERRISELLEVPLPKLNTKDLFLWFDALLDAVMVAVPDLLCYFILEIIKLIRRHFIGILDTEESCEECAQAIQRLAEKLQPLTPLSDDSMIVVDLETYRLIPWLKKQLDRWNYLRTKHLVKIPFELLSSQHNEEICQAIIFDLFDCVRTNGITFLIKDYVASFCQESRISCDKTIYDYLTTRMNVLHWGDSDRECCEERYVVFADCISSKIEKFEIVVSLLNKAMVPWSETMIELADKSLKNFPSKSKDIRNCIQFAQQKVILKKYGFLSNLESVDVPALMFFIIKSGKDSFWTDMMDYVSALGPEYYLQPYEVYLHYCIRNSFFSDVKKAIDAIVAKLHGRDLIKMKLFVVTTLNQILNKRNRFGRYATSETVELLTSFINNISPEGTINVHSITSVPYNNVLLLKTRYNVRVDPVKLFSPKLREEILTECVNYIYSVGLAEFNKNLPNYFIMIEELCLNATFLLMLPAELGLLQLALCALHKEDYETLCGTLRILSENCSFDSAVDLSKIIMDLCANILYSVPIGTTVTSSIFQFAHNLVSVALTNNLSVQWIKELLALKDLLSVVDKTRDKSILCAIAGTSTSRQVQLTQVAPPIETEFLRHLLKEIIGWVPKPDNMLKLENTSCTDETSDDSNPIVLMYSSFIEKCPADLHSIASSAKIHWLLSSKALLPKSVLKKTNNQILRMYSTVLLNLLSSKSYDMILALGLLHHLAPASQIQWLENVRYGKSQLTALLRNNALLGCAYFTLHESPQSKSYFKQYMAYNWETRLRKFNLRFSNDCNNTEQLEMLLNRLMKIPNVPLELLERFCKDFCLDYEKSMLMYLTIYLISWEPKFNDNISNVSEIEAAFNSEVQTLEVKCLQILNNIENKSDLKIVLKQIWPKISWYNYEVFSVLIKLLESLQAEDGSISYDAQKNVILFLLHYKRFREPSDQETDLWTKIGGKHENLPKVANYRLPFCPYVTPALDFYEFLKPEFQLSNYKQWFHLSRWFSQEIDKNTLCLSAIYNLKSEWLNNSPSWELDCRFKDLLNEIDECVSYMDNLEMATAALYFVSTRVMPPGADQLEAIQRCFLKANEWFSEGATEEATKHGKKVRQKYLNISTTHLLYKYKLASTEYLRLVSTPRELINALYRDPRIISSYDQDDCDINAIVDKICYLHEVKDLNVIKLELLMGWLEGDTTSLDDTSLMCTLPTNNFDSTNDLKRACYMMMGEDTRKVSLLLSIVLSDGTVSTPVPRSNNLRLRGLQCLMSIASPNQLENISHKNISFFRCLLRKLEIICQLEAAGLYFCEDSSEPEVSLSAVAESLIRGGFRPETSLIAAKIATFPFESPNVAIPLWSPIISSFTRFNQVNALEKYLPLITKIAYLLDGAILSSAWQLLIGSIAGGANENNLEEAERKIVWLLKCCRLQQNVKLHKYLPSIKNDKLRIIINNFIDSLEPPS